MHFSDVVRGEDGDEGGAFGGGFDALAAALLAVYEAEDTDDGHAGGAGGGECGEGGFAGGADVVEDEDLCAGFDEAFDEAAGAVGFFCLADEEAVEERGGGVLDGVPRGGGCGVRDERVGAHG